MFNDSSAFAHQHTLTGVVNELQTSSGQQTYSAVPEMGLPIPISDEKLPVGPPNPGIIRVWRRGAFAAAFADVSQTGNVKTRPNRASFATSATGTVNPAAGGDNAVTNFARIVRPGFFPRGYAADELVEPTGRAG